MERERIDALLALGETEYLIRTLEEELNTEYDEYGLFKLGQAYLLRGDSKKAANLMRRLHMVFPSGTLAQAGHRLTAAIASDRVSRYLEEELPSRTSNPEEKKKKQNAPALSPEITRYFEHVVGMHSLQRELDRFYKLVQFQKKRQQNRFNVELLKSSHFYIAGARGSGKSMTAEIIRDMLCDLGIRSRPQTAWLKKSIRAYASGDEPLPEEEFIFLDVREEMFEPENLPLLSVFLQRCRHTHSVLLMGTEELWEKGKHRLQDIIQLEVSIPRYSPEELLAILEKLAQKRAFLIHETAKKGLLRKLGLERNSSTFLNAITLNRMLDEGVQRMAERISGLEACSEAALVFLTREDFLLEEMPDIGKIIRELEELPGLRSVKAQVRQLVSAVQARQKLREADVLQKGGYGTLHMLFTGNPGTGKTTVARILGRIYHGLGVLSRGQVVECTRSDLVGQYQGHTAKAVREKVRMAAGGVLFIDEAYALCQGERDNFGREAVDELIAAIENNRQDMMVILAGYKEEMDTFLKTNPGFKSRIPNELYFEDYSPQEMTDIFRHMVVEKGMLLDVQVDQPLLCQLLELRSRAPDFGNARGVRNTLEKVISRMNNRISGQEHTSALDLSTITREDIQAVIGKEYEKHKTLDQLMEELNGLTGLAGVKKKISEMLDSIKVQEYIRQTEGLEQNTQGTMHLVFKGNAGTGKTTVARLLGQIYRELGLLKKNVFVEVSRADLVANYMGQTAAKVMEQVKKADGGILFIDEAYTLIQGKQDTFGTEAVGALVPVLENYRESLMVILAGYGPEMDAFLASNQGLTSRMSNEIFFEDYTQEELIRIFRHQARQRDLLLAEDCQQPLEALMARRSQCGDFGNARGVRNLLDQAETQKNSRIARQLRQNAVLERGAARTICAEDILAIDSAASDAARPMDEDRR